MSEKITTYYEKDHDRLDELFKNWQRLKNSDFEQAKANFREFNQGLKRHILWEENVLFPFFEWKTGMTQGPTAVMRMEHRQIGATLEAIHDKVRNRRTDSDNDEAVLLQVLSEHNRKEEMILYPLIDQNASDAERDDIYKKMADMPVNTGACCGGH